MRIYQARYLFFWMILSACSSKTVSPGMTLLTGLRTGEVIGAKWAEIDLARQIWVIPLDRSKDRRTRSEPHRVPLAIQVTGVLEGLPKPGEYVFPGLKANQSATWQC